jgi:adenylate kinase family enzyme
VKRVVVLGRGGAGKSTLSRQLARLAGLPVIELDTLFWQPGLVAADPARWAATQHELASQDTWIMDGDLGPYDDALPVRLARADTVIVLDLGFARCAWRTLARGRERADYWQWLATYRRRYLPHILTAVTTHAPHARVDILRSPRMVSEYLRSLTGPQWA